MPDFKILLPKKSKLKELSLFFRTAKVMENFIQQNFEKKIFKQFSTGFPVIGVKAGFREAPNGYGRGFQQKKQRVKNPAELPGLPGPGYHILFSLLW